MVTGRREPLHSLLPKLRILQKRKENKGNSPFVFRTVTENRDKVDIPIYLPPLVPVKKRKSIPTDIFPEIEKLPISSFERNIQGKEAQHLLTACEELFPGDPIRLFRTSDPLPTRLIPNSIQTHSPKPLSKPPISTRNTVSVMESLLQGYETERLPRVNVKGLEQARDACIQRERGRTRPVVINTPARLQLPTSHDNSG